MATEVQKFNAAVQSALLLDPSLKKINEAALPGLVPFASEFYRRPDIFTSAKRSVTLPANMDVKIGDTIYSTTQATTLSISSFGDVAGGNFYIYACVPASGTVPTFVISQNSTVPTGYTAATSRKIGGFHTLCASVGTTTYINSLTGATVAHPLNGYVKGDILPLSCWDLWHRPKGDPEGMVYCGWNNQDLWAAIYLLTWNGTKFTSTYGGGIIDGGATKKCHTQMFSEGLNMQNCRLPRREEYIWLARGSNEQTSINGGAKPGTAGGHSDSAGRRMISAIGCEDACGARWQPVQEIGFAGGSEWIDSFYSSAIDPRSYGRSYGAVYQLAVGGGYATAANSGSRCAACDRAPSYVGVLQACRAVSDPLHRNALFFTGYPIGEEQG